MNMLEAPRRAQHHDIKIANSGHCGNRFMINYDALAYIGTNEQILNPISGHRVVITH